MTGAASPHDDPTIADDEILLRRVAPEQMSADGNALRLTSNAFNDIADAVSGVYAVSVFVESRVVELGYSLERMLDGLDDFGLVAFTVGQARELGLGVTWAPNDQSMSEAHAHLNGPKPRAIRKRLVQVAQRRLWPQT